MSTPLQESGSNKLNKCGIKTCLAHLLATLIISGKVFEIVLNDSKDTAWHFCSCLIGRKRAPVCIVIEVVLSDSRLLLLMPQNRVCRFLHCAGGAAQSRTDVLG